MVVGTSPKASAYPGADSAPCSEQLLMGSPMSRNQHQCLQGALTGEGKPDPSVQLLAAVPSSARGQPQPEETRNLYF